MDRQLKNETANWRRTNRQLSEPMSDCFTDDLWMIYPWTCFCLSKHQRPLTSETAASEEREESRLICLDLKDDPLDAKHSLFTKGCLASSLQIFFKIGGGSFAAHNFKWNLIQLDHYIKGPKPQMCLNLGSFRFQMNMNGVAFYTDASSTLHSLLLSFKGQKKTNKKKTFQCKI